MAVARLTKGLSLPSVDRRTVAGIVLAAAAATLVLVLTRPAPTVPVLVAAADLDTATPLAGADVRVRQVASADGLVEGDSLGELDGWWLAAPLAAGEPLVPSLLRPPVRIDEPDLISVAIPQSQAVLGRLAPGDLIDIYATSGAAGTGDGVATELLATDVYVVEARSDAASVAGEVTVELLLAVDDDLAARIAVAVHVAQFDVVRLWP